METANTDGGYDFDDDDDDIVLVSSTRQKWEKLHGIHTIANNDNNNIQSKNSDADNDEGGSENGNSDEQTGRMGIRNSGRRQEEEEEDEILVVTVRPTQSKHAITIRNEELSSSSCSRLSSVYSYDRRFQICVLFVAIALSVGRQRSRIIQPGGPISDGKIR